MVMERCENKVEYHIESGLDYKQVLTKCGYTNPYGKIAICNECLNNRDKLKSIRNHEENVKADNDWLKSCNWGEM
jgi:hypothetical protein|tara:strand:- start:143 stop:367 length:225 start_codon:yes stop_codon:yes gene_type:complete